MEIQTSTKKSLLLAGWLFIVKLIETFGGVFAPDIPKDEKTEGKCGKRSPVTADDGHAVVIDDDDEKSAGNGDGVGGFEDDL